MTAPFRYRVRGYARIDPRTGLRHVVKPYWRVKRSKAVFIDAVMGFVANGLVGFVFGALTAGVAAAMIVATGG